MKKIYAIVLILVLVTTTVQANFFTDWIDNLFGKTPPVTETIKYDKDAFDAMINITGKNTTTEQFLNKSIEKEIDLKLNSNMNREFMGLCKTKVGSKVVQIDFETCVKRKQEAIDLVKGLNEQYNSIK